MKYSRTDSWCVTKWKKICINEHLMHTDAFIQVWKWWFGPNGLKSSADCIVCSSRIAPYLAPSNLPLTVSLEMLKRSTQLLPRVCWVSHTADAKLQTGFLRSPAVDLCIPSRFPMGLLVVSLIHLLLVRMVSLGGRPFLGRFVVVLCSFHYLMMDFMVLCEMFKAWAIFL